MGKDRDVQVCDVWSAMMALAGWNESDSGSLPGSEGAAENQVLRSFLSDGKLPLTGTASPYCVAQSY